VAENKVILQWHWCLPDLQRKCNIL